MLIGLILVAAGCGRYKPPAPPSTVAVKGKILLPSGSPATGGRISFKPKNPALQTGISEIEKDGSFNATSFNKGDGLMPGEYVAVLEPVSYKTGSAVSVRGIPPKYQSASSSDLVINVDKAEENLVLRMR